jgi:hypothetical protein
MARWHVKYKRRLLGIPPFEPPPHEPIDAFAWTPSDLAILGTISDRPVAERLGTTVAVVAFARQRR